MDAQQFLAEFGHIASAPNGVQRLREMVLQLAVMGRLVEHNTQDGDVEQELISAQKERAVREDKIGRKSSKNEELNQIVESPYPIPSHWRWVALGNLALYIQRGKGPNYADRGQVRVISQKCVQWTGFDLTPARWIDDRSIDAYGNERFLQPNDLLWNSTGTGTVGRIAIFPGFKDKKMVADSHVTVMRPTKCLSSRYLWCLIASPGIQVRVDPVHKNPIVSGTTNQVELSTSFVRALPIPLPPLAEQKRIVAKVDELMALCDRLEALQNRRKMARAVLTKEILGRVASNAAVDVQTCLQNLSLLVSDVEQIPVLRQTILSLAVQGKLVTHYPQNGDLAQEIEIAQRERAAHTSKIGGRATRSEELIQLTECPYPIPSHWRWVALGNLALYIQRGKGPRYADRGKVQVISQKCVQWSGFDPTPARWVEDRSIEVYGSERFLQPDDLLWNSTGTGTVGRIVVFPGFKDKKMVADSHVTVLRPAKCLIPRYLWCLIASPGVQVRMDPAHKYPIVSGTTNQVELSTSVVRTLPIPLPPLAEQKRIVAKVDELMALCDMLEAKLRKASQVQEQLAISAIAALTGIHSQEKETMKAPKTELVARLKIGKKPSAKDQAPLAALLIRHHGELDSKALWQHSGMERIDDFYHQLKFEMNQGWIVQPEMPTIRVVGDR